MLVNKQTYVYEYLYTVCQKNLCTEEKKIVKFDLHSSIPTIKSFCILFLVFHTFYKQYLFTTIRHQSSYWKRIIEKNNKKKFRYLTTIWCILVFLQVRWHVKWVNKILVIKVIVLNATSVVIFQYKNTRKTSFKKYYRICLFCLLHRQICEGNLLICVPWKSELYIISHPVLNKKDD